MDEHEYITYVLSDQGTPFYVGKGRDQQRAYSHALYAKTNDLADLGYGLTRDYNPHKTRKIRKLLSEGREVEYSFFYHKDEAAAFAHEVELVSKHGRWRDGGTLTNITSGGNGGSILDAVSFEEREDIIRRRSTTLKNRPEELKALSQSRRQKSLADKSLEQQAATRAKISAASKAFWANLSESERKDFSQRRAEGRKGIKTGPSPLQGRPATGRAAKGVKQAWNKGLSPDDPRHAAHREAVIAAHQAKDRQWSGGVAFKLVSPTGEIVEGNSLAWLIETYNLSPRVSALISGKCSTYKGWIRREDLGLIEQKATTRRVRGGKPLGVERYTLDGELLDVWPTIKAAAESVGGSSGTLSTRIAEGKPFKGFVWKTVK